jgi:hypothetical protein
VASLGECKIKQLSENIGRKGGNGVEKKAGEGKWANRKKMDIEDKDKCM